MRTLRQTSRGQRSGRIAALACGLGAFLALALAAGQANAEDAILFEVLVAQASPAEGAIDPKARRLHEEIRGEFRYGSLRVLDTEKLSIAPGSSGEVALPNGKKLRIQPILADERGILIGVEVEGAVKGDFRVKRGQLVVIGAQGYQDGKLVIALEAN